MFEGMRSWSWPSHLELSSEWAAVCTNDKKATSCVTNPNAGQPHPGLELPWANLFQLLDQYGVSWKYYLGAGNEPDCEDDGIACPAQPQTPGVPSVWNTPPYFGSVQRNGAKYLSLHNPDSAQLFNDVKTGRLPQVSWVVPAAPDSEHPPAGITRGMEYVTGIVNTVMRSPYWKDTAIFIAWDDWGGFYDHVAPPNVDHNNTETPIQGYGLRVPGIMISAYARAGTIDHAVLSFDSYATFIEDLFMNGARLDPKALGNPDHRPDIRDAITQVSFPNGRTAKVGNLMDEFDFTQTPLPPLELSAAIPTGIAAVCGPNDSGNCTQPTVMISWNRVGPGRFSYRVERDGTDLPQCTSTAISCTDVPGSGTHLYRVYGVSPKGRNSPRSAAAEIRQP
jgi:phospholipase C